GKEKKYPEGTLFNDYCIVREKQGTQVIPTIRRWVIFPDGKRRLERYPTSRYRNIRSNEQELKDFVVRLNNQIPGEHRTREAVDIKHAFIGQEMLDEYLGY